MVASISEADSLNSVLVTGTLSPVSIDSSITTRPLIRIASAGMVIPAVTTKQSPGTRVRSDTSRLTLPFEVVTTVVIVLHEPARSCNRLRLNSLALTQNTMEHTVMKSTMVE